MSRKPQDFDVEVRRSGATAHIVLEGELDLESVPAVERLLERLREDQARHLVLDLRGLRFIDSSGLNLLLQLDAAARADGFDLSLVQGGRHVQHVFELTGLKDHFNLVEPGSLPEADAA
jgi:anti-sigma B factor antagonist